MYIYKYIFLVVIVSGGWTIDGSNFQVPKTLVTCEHFLHFEMRK